LHNLRLQSLFSSVSGNGLGDHRRLIVGRDPSCDAMVREVASEVGDDRANEIIMEMLDFCIGA
jgi:hypothetical protein